MSGDVRLTDVVVSFPGPGRTRHPALDGIDLTIAPGTFIALIGPNGCGKSTLLRAMAGLLTPEHGSVVLDGGPIVGPDPRIGLVFQEPRLLPWRTGAANITYPLELAGWSADHQAVRLAEVVDRVGLDAPALAARPAALSGGTRQRVALGRSLVMEPDVLLLDEPFSALDALTRERFDLELLRLGERAATTIVMVTHSIEEAILVADRVLVLSPRPGRIVADIPIDIARPRTIEAIEGPEAARAAIAIRAHLELQA